MIELYTGLVGGGKTLSCIDRAMRYLSAGGCVVSNITFDLDKVRDYLLKVYHWHFSEGQIIHISNIQCVRIHEHIPEGNKEKPVLCIIDECSEFYDAHENFANIKECCSFFRQSRKYAVDLVFITQDVSLLAKRVRVLLAFHWYCINMKTFKFGGFMFWPFPQICLTCYDRLTPRIVARKFLWMNPALFDLYKTAETYHQHGLLTGIQTDFKNKVEGKKMSNAWKVCVVGSYVLIICVFAYLVNVNSSLRASIKGSLSAVETSASSVYEGGKRIIERPFLGYSVVRGQVEMWIDGFCFSVHHATPYGRCESVSIDRVETDKYIINRLVKGVQDESSNESKDSGETSPSSRKREGGFIGGVSGVLCRENKISG